jgi:hypothetical protein
MRRKLTEDQKTARRLARAWRRDRDTTIVEERRAWHQSRAIAAEKRTEKAAERRRKNAARVAKAQAKADAKDRKRRGQTAPVGPVPYTIGKHGTTIDSTLGTAVIAARRITGTHEQRRAAGQRGHIRKPRRRELPRAVAAREREGAES